jgi:hypothetical protein
LGEHAFQLDLSNQTGKPSIQQPLPLEIARGLKYSPVTVGAWIWSTEPMSAQMPEINCYCGNHPLTFSRKIKSGTEPMFFKFTAIIPATADFVWVTLTPPENFETGAVKIFYDGLVLVKGEMLVNDPPHFDGDNGDTGIWGGQPFTNLIRNPSAEQSGLGVRSWANVIGMKIIPSWPASYPSDVLVSFLDWKGAGWYYRVTGTAMLRTFWAKFGWGTVPLLGDKPYRVLAVVTLLGLGGAGWALWRRRLAIHWELFLLLGLALLGIWVPAILRGIGSLFGWLYVPVARYASPAILPTILVLNIGWLESSRLLGRWLRVHPKVLLGVYLLFFVALDILSLLSIIHYFYRS